MLTIAIWAAALAVSVPAAMGPTRWFRRVTSQLRPDRAEPTGRGRDLIGLRNVLVAVLAISSALWWTLDGSRVSASEWEESVAPVLAGRSGEVRDIDGNVLLHDLRLSVGEVTVIRVTTDSVDDRYAFFEVSPGSPSDEIDTDALIDESGNGHGQVRVDDPDSVAAAKEGFDRGNRPTVCVTVRRLAPEGPATIRAQRGRCDATEGWKQHLTD